MQYTPGYTQNATDFMARRTLDSHGHFFLGYLKDGMAVLDCGCGPGTMTCDIATRVPNGRVTGVDRDASQVAYASAQAADRSIQNVDFQCASVYDLPFGENTYDAVFSHALLEHLDAPEKAIVGFFRVLRPGGVLAVCSPDWGGFLFAPPCFAFRLVPGSAQVF